MAAIVLLHPFPVDARFWDDVTPTLAAMGHEVIAPDLPGFGQRAAEPGWTMNGEADRLAAEMPDGAAVVGLSMGGYLALALVARHPSRVGSLVLADTRAEAEPPEGMQARRDTVQALRARGTDEFVAAFVPRALGPHPRAGAAERLTALASAQSAEAMADATLAIAGREEHTGTLATITAPTLVIVGEHDAITPPALSTAMAAAIPHATLAIIGGAGHMTAIEQPEEFAALVLQHELPA